MRERRPNKKQAANAQTISVPFGKVCLCVHMCLYVYMCLYVCVFVWLAAVIYCYLFSSVPVYFSAYL